MVVANQHIKALVDDRRVGKFFMHMAGREGRDRRVERRRVSHACILVARRKRTGDRPHRSRAGKRRAVDLLCQPLGFGHHLAGRVDLRPGDVAVHVNPAGHDDESFGVIDAIGPAVGVSGSRDNAAIVDPDIADFARDAVLGIVDCAAGDFEEGHGNQVGVRVNGRPNQSESVI